MPCWSQIYRSMKQIINRPIEEGSRLPNERELAELYGVSRVTMRQALTELESDGYIERVQGSGTFVAHRKPRPARYELALNRSWPVPDPDSRSAQTTVLPPLDAELPFELKRLLDRVETKAPKTMLRRRHELDERPIGVINTWLVTERAPGIEKLELVEGSLTRTLLEKFDLTEASREQALEGRPLDLAEAELLQASADAGAIVVWTVGRLADGRLLRLERSVWVASRVRFRWAT